MGAAKESWGLVASTTVRGRLPQLDGSVCLIGSGARCRPRETGFLREPGAPPFPLDRRYRMKWASCAHGPIGRRDDVFFWGGEPSSRIASVISVVLGDIRTVRLCSDERVWSKIRLPPVPAAGRRQLRFCWPFPHHAQHLPTVCATRHFD
ncbi:uncharacterized protein K444DRAFT_371078 [Hyaloscypha bicolor E]|uniref:Uncharacterized protein n=1 Tax=Hyaloscypha bicolor E TaxID=1095630 RepID=A0A2J6TEM1_9HELO|nr:uncharacterized protein K444DRAFT_371078 [Hyaloscypha bicolor E]PMD61467.1 hypothetical protein K444DRAFT_371078 [Hyaloscypha bicolor E]